MVPRLLAPREGVDQEKSMGPYGNGETGGVYSPFVNRTFPLSLAKIAILILLAGSTAFVVSCEQPVSSSATAQEAFDTNRPTTPSITPSFAPVTHELGRGRVHFFSVSPVLNFGLTPGAPARYRIDGGAWIGPSSTLTQLDTAGFTDGSYLIELEERDPAGNWSETYSYAFVIDSIPPAPPVFSPNTAATTSSTTPRFYWQGDAVDGSRKFTGEISGPGVTLQGLPIFDFTERAPGSEFSAAPVTFSGPGTVTITLWEYDYAANASASSSYTMEIVAAPLARWFSTTSVTSDGSSQGHTLSLDTAIGQVAPVQVSNDYIDLSSSLEAGYHVTTPNSLHTGSDGQTISFWLLGNELGTDQGAILTRLREDALPTGSVLAIGTQPASKLLRLAINNWAQLAADIPTSALSASFNHIVYVFDYSAVTVSVYVDGAPFLSDVSVAGGEFYAEMTDPGRLYIGHRPGSTLSDQAAQVRIDDVQLYGYPLAASAVSELYSVGRQ